MKQSLFALCTALVLLSCGNMNKETGIQVSTPVEKSNDLTETEKTPRVTGIGGIFFSSANPSETKAWYGDKLGLAIDDHGSAFEFRNANDPEEINYLRWSLFNKESDYFSPSDKDFMINYRVQNLEGLVADLEKNDVMILDSISTYSYGKFIHIMDPDGNKIELWEPVDSVLTAMGGKTTK